MRSVEDGGSLAQQTYERLKGEIIGLHRPPGQRLVERELATGLGVSRIPLREALRLLEAEGLVVIVPRQGALVAPFTAADVRHLLDVRESLEGLAARLAASNADATGVATARAALTAARDAMASGDDRAVAAANAGFHEAVVGLSGNPLLQSLMQPLTARLRWLFHLAYADDVNLRLCEEHEEILAAIADGDADRAGDLAGRHVRATRALTLEMAARWAAPDLDPVEATRSRQRERKG
ncbi:GntR family transcriptional regulator [Nocardioides sp.]|uniref:GntR family transcriptional regulator n=1 Tax=Nocardioides sp. TaxID=35761 RepID=UPI002C71AAC4|nr:GntR family transcriptional regulator [Nocardioides sp.]HSX66458.1 GntR family transcriptional regulator [Nocardioides sp.]